ncbi:hypothetical protein [Gilvimarinus algae]|uniref:SMODS and SLOG-associating 2TM effector domain-containing protein n=1 Tax=Gilvimarinus algae TaxID=3058037 RepID=A0ABT8TCH0_9GAMM|nr:hypothetical protein [Gilvimarinus sp. SDUM040014]MDO3381068.1 hypothetical protein [Gilvimarinus sp. SDUM040014]
MEKLNEDRKIKLLQHPVFIKHEPGTRIVKAQLLFFSLSAIALLISDLDIGPNSSILGINLVDLEKSDILWLLFSIIIYQLSHFFWISIESFSEWRVRQTALDTGGWDGGGDRITEEDLTLKVRNTSIYRFLIRGLLYDAEKIKESANALGTKSDKELKQIQTSLDNILELLRTPRLDDALWRFDHWFLMLCKMQNYRWLMFEFLIPIALGVFALSLIIQSST